MTEAELYPKDNAGGKKKELKQALKRLHRASSDEVEKVKKEVAKYFKDASLDELVFAEQELIQEGVGRDEMKRLCDVHLEVMKDKLGRGAKRLKLASWHPIRISMDEHKIIKKNLKRLKRTLDKLEGKDSFKTAVHQVNTVKELAHFFLETEKHHKREEEVLFPRLEAHGITEPPQIFKEDHVEFLAKKKMLYDLVMNTNGKDFREFLNLVTPIIEFLVKNLEDHIYKEDNILYPIALKTLDKDEWKDVRKKFDAIGYCCFVPRDIKKKEK